MKNNELRIGNFVNYLGENYQVVEIGLIGILGTSKEGQFASKLDNPHLQPIELTEEWLLKFGFKYGFGKTERLYLSIDGIQYYLWGNKSDNFSTCLFIVNDLNKIKVKYVHELQNLFFALTGVELQLSST